MPDSPPLTPPQQNESPEPDTQQNPNSISDSEDPCRKSQLSTTATQNPPSENPVDDQIQTEEQPEIAVEDDDDQDQHDDPDPEPDPELENAESEGMNITHSPISQSTNVYETHNLSQEMKGNNNNQAAFLRRSTKRKKGSKNHAFTERKTKQLLKRFNPIPFVPGKTLDFSRYKEFLEKLGLWDFAHIEFDRNFRADLIGQLIVSYSQKVRGSYVNGLKIGVSRADLARALKLPVPTPKKLDCDVDDFPQDFLSFLEEFVSNWMLLHEDLWCTPNDIVMSLKNIKDGNPHKVDWAGLIWYMVEKELTKRQSLKDCYYASHLQQLIKMQKEEVFLENPDVGVANPKVVAENSKEAVMVDDDEDGDDVKMTEIEDLGRGGQKLEEQNVELRLGQDCVAEVENIADADKVEKDSDDCCVDAMEKVEGAVKPKEEDEVGNSESANEGNKDENMENSEPVDNVVNAEILRSENKDVEMMEFGGDYKEEEQGQGQWFLDSKLVGQQFLQRCSVAEMKAAEDRRLEGVGEDDEVEEDGPVEGFKIMPKSQLDGMTSANLMQAFGTGQLPYSSTELGGHSSLELMSSRTDDNLMLGGPSMFNHAGKREIDHGHDMSHHGLNDIHKRMRVDGSWDDKPPEFTFCMEQIQSWAEKAKIRQMAEIDEAYQQANMAQDIYSQQLTQKESEIVQLRYKLDDIQRIKQAELDRLNRELYLMNSVIDGYRKALKQTQNTFAEYRKLCQVPDEPVYKDAGLGGVVKSVTELERERLKQEEENKLMRKFIEETFRENLDDCEMKWESEVVAKVLSHHSRLLDVVKEVELLKDHNIKRKTSADVQNELQDPSE